MENPIGDAIAMALESIDEYACEDCYRGHAAALAELRAVLEAAQLLLEQPALRVVRDG